MRNKSNNHGIDLLVLWIDLALVERVPGPPAGELLLKADCPRCGSSLVVNQLWWKRRVIVCEKLIPIIGKSKNDDKKYPSGNPGKPSVC